MIEAEEAEEAVKEEDIEEEASEEKVSGETDLPTKSAEFFSASNDFN